MKEHRHTCWVCEVNLRCNNSKCLEPDTPYTWNCGAHDITHAGAVACLRSRRAGRPIFTPIVERAMLHRICDLGQFTHAERLQVERAVRNGVLSKGKGGPYPKLKTVYAAVHFDFARDREAGVAELRRAHMIDMARGTDKFFPWVAFEQVQE